MDGCTRRYGGPRQGGCVLAARTPSSMSPRTVPLFPVCTGRCTRSTEGLAKRLSRECSPLQSSEVPLDASMRLPQRRPPACTFIGLRTPEGRGAPHPRAECSA